MAKLSNIEKSYGKDFTIAVANCNSNTLLSSYALPANTIIIASDSVPSYSYDSGSHTIAITDYDNSPVRLTYTICPGNGLSVDGDILSIQLDNHTLVENNNKITLNLDNIANNTSIQNIDSQLQVITYNLATASENTIGTVKIDNYTISLTNDNQLYVNTENLLRATNYNAGIVNSDMNTIDIHDGIISVATNGLNHADNTTSGTIIGNTTYITAQNGILTAITNNLSYATNDSFGISIPDGDSIIANDGVYSIQNIDKANDAHAGIICVDSETMVSNNGVIEIKNYNKLVIAERNIANKVKKLKNINVKINSVINDDNIHTLMCNNVSSTILTRPTYGIFSTDMTDEYVTAELIINTSCQFYLNIEFENNIYPSIYIVSILYNGYTYKGDTYKNEKFKSTNLKNIPLKIVFGCKNFADNNDIEIEITNIRITATNAFNDLLKLSTIYSVVRYNSLYKNDLSSLPNIIVSPNTNDIENINIVGKKEIKRFSNFNIKNINVSEKEIILS